jgi:hypothetical protein
VPHAYNAGTHCIWKAVLISFPFQQAGRHTHCAAFRQGVAARALLSCCCHYNMSTDRLDFTVPNSLNSTVACLDTRQQASLITITIWGAHEPSPQCAQSEPYTNVFGALTAPLTYMGTITVPVCCTEDVYKEEADTLHSDGAAAPQNAKPGSTWCTTQPTAPDMLYLSAPH